MRGGGQTESEHHLGKNLLESLSTKNRTSTRILESFLERNALGFCRRSTLTLKSDEARELPLGESEQYSVKTTEKSLSTVADPHYPDTKMQEGTSKGRGKFGFTLAEVLITLGIIGIVAAMTMPTLIQKYKKQEAETRLKRAYSILTQAFTLAVAKNGDNENWAEWDNAETILQKYFAPEIKGAKVYSAGETGLKSMCYDGNFPNSYTDSENKAAQYGWMDKVYMSTPFFDNITSSIKLSDGICIGLNPVLTDPMYSKRIFVDINGSNKGPNMAGYDLFFFKIIGNKIVPMGYNWAKDTLSDSSTTNSCHLGALRGGLSCAAYIMSRGWKITYW